MDESDDRDPAVHGNVVYSTFNDKALLSVAEAPNPVPGGNAVAQLIIRDAVGRHAWIFGMHFDSETCNVNSYIRKNGWQRVSSR